MRCVSVPKYEYRAGCSMGGVWCTLRPALCCGELGAQALTSKQLCPTEFFKQGSSRHGGQPLGIHSLPFESWCPGLAWVKALQVLG